MGQSSSRKEEMANVKVFVDGKIAGKKVVMFSKTWCGFCQKAKRVFQEYLNSGALSQDDYEVIELDNRNDVDAMQDYLRSVTGARSVPRVFINGKCIGGGDETEALHRKGGLVPMLS